MLLSNYPRADPTYHELPGNFRREDLAVVLKVWCFSPAAGGLNQSFVGVGRRSLDEAAVGRIGGSLHPGADHLVLLVLEVTPDKGYLVHGGDGVGP